MENLIASSQSATSVCNTPPPSPPPPLSSNTCVQWEGKVEEGQNNFDEISKTLKREVERFEVSPYPSSLPS